MIDFFIVDEAGQIIMTGECSESELPLYRHLGKVVRGKAQLNQQYYRDGTLNEIPSSPSEVHRFCQDHIQWVLDWDKVREKRDALLTSCDWCVLPDSPLEEKNLWKIYRQELRDITKNTEFDGIKWPTPPHV